MIRTSLLALALLAVSLPLAAQKVAPGSLPEFSENDYDNNGVVTVEEATRLAPAVAVAAIKACDTDRNGQLSRDEYAVCNGSSTPADQSR
jgi:hypothetical protein